MSSSRLTGYLTSYTRTGNPVYGCPDSPRKIHPMKPVDNHHPINVPEMSTMANAKQEVDLRANNLRKVLGHGIMAHKLRSIEYAIQQVPELRVSGVYYIRP